jgi:hypothetical protein
MILDPECYKSNSIFFVRPNGIYLPCCYSGTSPLFEKYLGAELYSQLDLNKYSMEEVVESEAWAKIKQMIESDNPIAPCRDFCVANRDHNYDLSGNLRQSLINNENI